MHTMSTWFWHKTGYDTKEEDGEFKHKKANEEVISICYEIPFSPTPDALG
jgi:hypothetical protein